MTDLLVLAGVVFVFGLVSRRLEGTVLTAPIVFVVAGAFLGPAVLGLVEFGLDEHTVLLVGEIALAIVLFTDAARINFSALRQYRGIAPTPSGYRYAAHHRARDRRRGAAAHRPHVLGGRHRGHGPCTHRRGARPGGRELTSASRFACARPSTSRPGSTMAFRSPSLRSSWPWRWPKRSSSLPASGYASPWSRWVLGFSSASASGWPGVGSLRRASQREWMTESFQRLSLLVLAIFAWALADQIGGNGFIAAFVGGLAAGPTVERVGERLMRFTEAEGQLLNLSVFFIFGVLVIGVIQPLSWEVVLYVVLSLTVIRMLPVALSLIGTHLGGVSVLFMGWFGPRGLASIVLGLIVVEEAPLLAGRDEMVLVVALTVLLSVLLHGVTAAPLSAVYARRVEGMAAGAPEKQDAVELPTRMGSVSTSIHKDG